MTRQIDKGVPIPRNGECRRSESSRLAETMDVGDSVLCQSEAEADRLRGGLYALKRKATGRKCADGWRVWRVA